MLNRRIRNMGATTVALALPLVLISIPTSVADPAQNPETAVALVDQAVDIAEGASSARSLSVESADSSSEISLPTDADPSASISTADAGTLSITPPSGETKQHGAAALTTAENTVVSQQVDNHTVRQSAVLDADSSERQEYVLTSDREISLELTESGAIDIVHPSESGRFVTGQIEAPWAIDAEGKSLPTRYDIEGSKVTQVVDTDNAAFPVVADPKITYGAGVYLNLTGTEMNAVSAAAGSILAGGVFVGCTVTNIPVPSVVKTIIKVACNLGGIPLVKAIFGELANNPMQYDPRQCYQRKYPANGRGFVGVGRENCNW